VPSTDGETDAVGKAFDGNDFIVSRKRWVHILERHPELSGLRDLILDAGARPDEVFVDPRGSLHLLRVLEAGASGYLVLILRKAGLKDYLVTAYLSGEKRKKRRYRKFKKLPLC
jgi:hypothetical protein